MCGIAALILTASHLLEPEISAMIAVQSHRGPDGSGIEILPNDGVALGSCRLKILDFAGGGQPVWTEARDNVLVFNGEIYNAVPLRNELVEKGHRFASTSSDTEVLVHGYEEWGLLLPTRLEGMFAFALWDRDKKRLFAARDRCGEKPLFFAELPGGFAVCSELKGLMATANLRRQADPLALDQLVSFGMVVPPRTMVSGVGQVPPGHYALIHDGELRLHPYWTPRPDVMPVPTAQLLARLDETLATAVERQLRADVPVGLLVSGGLDSAVVAYYARRVESSVDAFTVGLAARPDKNLRVAALVANHLGLRHHVVAISDDEVPGLLDAFLEVLDEPVGTADVLQRFALARLAGAHVRAALSGDGSDELFLGYPDFRRIRLAAWCRSLPPGFAQGASMLLAPWHRMPSSRSFSDILRSSAAATPHRLMASYRLGPVPTALLRSSVHPKAGDAIEEILCDADLVGLDWSGQAAILDLRVRLGATVLTRLDRTSMAHGLEVRAPFLDRGVIDLALAMSPAMKLRGRTGKWILRRLMRDRLPPEVVFSSKSGVGGPMGAWLRGPLRPIMFDALSEANIRRGGLLAVAPVRRLVDEHLSARNNHAIALRTLLFLQLWQRKWAIEPPG